MSTRAARARCGAGLLWALACGLGACGSKASAVIEQIVPEPADDPAKSVCPAFDAPYVEEACQDLPQGYGTQPALPLQWGRRGVGELLWEGRISCADGTTPHLMRLSPYGPPPQASSAATSDVVIGAQDVLDRWRVNCSGLKPMTLYHNIYRCGSACPPAGLTLVPADAWTHYQDSIKAYQRGSATQALLSSGQAVEAAPGHETLLNWHALMLSEAGKWPQALALYDRVASMGPHGQTVHIRRAEVLLLLKRKAQAADVLRRVMSLIERNDTRRPYLTCLLSTALMVTDPTQAIDLARQACVGGERACCD